MDLKIQQKQAARRMGIHQMTMINWLKGRAAPAIRHWPKVIQFLGYDPRPRAVDLAGRLRSYRELRGWSLAEAGSRLGINETVLWRWESGHRKPQDRHLAKIYRFIGGDPRPAPTTLGARLKRRREELGLTLTVMAARLRVSQATLCRWESGEREPKGRFIETAQEALTD